MPVKLGWAISNTAASLLMVSRRNIPMNCRTCDLSFSLPAKTSAAASMMISAGFISTARRSSASNSDVAFTTPDRSAAPNTASSPGMERMCSPSSALISMPWCATIASSLRCTSSLSSSAEKKMTGPDSSMIAPSQSVARTVATPSCNPIVVLPAAPSPVSIVTGARGIRVATSHRRFLAIWPAQDEALMRARGRDSEIGAFPGD